MRLASNIKDKTGFTILEFIIALTLVAIAGTLLVTYLDTSLSAGVDPAVTLDESFALHEVMENICANATNDFALMSSRVGAEGSTQVNSYGEYDVIHNRYISFSGGAEQAGGTNMLKITISRAWGNGNEESLTRVFVR